MADAIETAADAPDDISAAIGAAITEHGEPGAAPVEKPAPKAAADESAKPDAKPAKAAAADDGEAKPAAKAGERARGADGKFLKADGSAETDASTDKAGEAAVSADKAAATEGDKAAAETKPVDGDGKLEPEISAMLARMPASDKDKVLALPADAQKILAGIVKLQTADYTKKTQALASLKTEYDPVEQMFAPFRDLMKQKGLSPAATIGAWFNVEKRLMQGDGANVIKGLVAGYGIDPRAVAQALNLAAPSAGQGNGQILDGDGKPIPGIQQQGQVELPPQLVAVLDNLARKQDLIDRRLAGADQEMSNQSRLAAQNAADKIMNDIETFKGADDGKGSLLHPHFEEVEAAMTTIALGYAKQGQQAPPLQELYETAVWASPSTRAKLIAADKQAEEKRTADEARAKAARAAKAGSSTTGAPGAGQAAGIKPVERSLAQELEAAFETHAT